MNGHLLRRPTMLLYWLAIMFAGVAATACAAAPLQLATPPAAAAQPPSDGTAPHSPPASDAPPASAPDSRQRSAVDGALPATAATPAAQWLPADTLFFARFPNVAEFRRQWDASSFGAQADDPAFAAFFADLLQRVSGATDGLGVGITTLWTNVDGELSLGVVRNATNDLSLVAIADFGDPSSAKAIVDRLETQLRTEAADSTSIEVADTQLMSWQRSRDRTLANVSYFTQGGKVVFSDQVQTLAEAARTGRVSAAPSLGDSPEFQHVIQRVVPAGEASGISWYVNPSAVVDAAVRTGMAGNPSEQTVQTLMDAVGLDQLRGLGGAFWLGKGNVDSLSTTYGYVETPVEGFWQAFTLPAEPQQPPDWVKDDVSLYSQINWNADRFYQSLKTVVDRARGEGTFDNTIGQMQVGQSGLTVGQLAGRLTGPLHIAAEIPADAGELTRQKAIVAIELQDPQRIRQLVSDYAERAGAEVQQSGDHQVYHFRPDLSDLANLPPLGFAVAVTDDALMLSPNAEYLGATLGERASMRPLADSPDYQEIAAQFPERTSMITYQHQDSRMAGLYEQLRAGGLGGNLPGLTGQLLNFDFTKLPPWPAMSRYLQTTGSFIVPEEDGFRIVSFALPPREQ